MICAPVTGGVGEIWSSKRCAIEASISRSALIRTSAAVARSTTSSLMNASAPRVLSRRANSCMLIICSLILGLPLIHLNPPRSAVPVPPPGLLRPISMPDARQSPSLRRADRARRPAGPSHSAQPMLDRDALKWFPSVRRYHACGDDRRVDTAAVLVAPGGAYAADLTTRLSAAGMAAQLKAVSATSTAATKNDWKATARLASSGLAELASVRH